LPPRQIGIVIPTHNRCAALLECLKHLEKQTFSDFEVVIIDDGSTDDTSQRIDDYKARTSLEIRYVKQENGGPAKARNKGADLLDSRICLFMGDDIFASPTLVELHLRAHEDHPDTTFCALGLTRWNTSGQKVTRFMRWLDEGNVQFAYPLLLAGTKPDWCHFYTSNLSVKTELVKMFPFNERFPYAAMEDSELAYRIKRRSSLEIQFIPEALADHLHPTTFRQACRRMLRIGYSCSLFYELWPEQTPPPSSRLRAKFVTYAARHPALLKPLMNVASVLTAMVCPNRFMGFVLNCFLEAGVESRRSGKRISS